MVSLGAGLRRPNASFVNSGKMLRPNYESTVDSKILPGLKGPRLARNTLAVGRLGTKRQCPACGAKYYDLGRKPPTCSRCAARPGRRRAENDGREADRARMVARPG